jgi:DNA polymerase III delta prime subunit
MSLTNLRTIHTFQSIVAQPSHALLLTGPANLGAWSEAKELAEMLKKKLGAIVLSIEPHKDKQAIGIDQIKELYHTARTRQNGGMLVMVLQGIDVMRPEAQNAFLKLLEEPGDDIIFILEARVESHVLQTIRSRCHHIEAGRLNVVEARTLCEKRGIDSQVCAQLLFLAEANASECLRLISNNVYQKKQLALATQAKTFLSANAYDRLVITVQFSKQKEDALAFVRQVVRMAELTLRSNATNQHILMLLENMETTYQALVRQGHIKTQLLRAVTSLQI